MLHGDDGDMKAAEALGGPWSPMRDAHPMPTAMGTEDGTKLRGFDSLMADLAAPRNDTIATE